MTRLLARCLLRSRDLRLELVALRQQVGALRRKGPRPQFSRWDHLFWLEVLVIYGPNG